ncbi:MAG: prepilin-type N-terminal cleavage/methylation domain-containing protein, partial [Verrucomicrobiota bacterium]
MKALLANLLGAIGKSFTLVELLVVVAIIGVLAALLLPAVGTAKDRAKAVVCAHNEKRMGEAFNSYLNDNQGFYPYIYPTCANTTNNNT